LIGLDRRLSFHSEGIRQVDYQSITIIHTKTREPENKNLRISGKDLFAISQALQIHEVSSQKLPHGFWIWGEGGKSGAIGYKTFIGKEIS